MTSDGQRSHGWRQMLNVYVARPLDTAIDRAGQNYTYTWLYTDPQKKAAWEQDVLDAPDLVNRQTDGDTEFFLNFAITLQKPEPPQAIKDALVKQQGGGAGQGRGGRGSGARPRRRRRSPWRRPRRPRSARIKVLGREAT